MADHHVDRPEVYAWQHVQLTGTNRPRAWFYIPTPSHLMVFVLAMEFSEACSSVTKGFGGDSGGVTPVPIPNTEVKPASADGTWAVTPWESRTPPDFSRNGPRFGGARFAFWLRRPAQPGR